jgi:chromosome segregation ATPase
MILDAQLERLRETTHILLVHSDSLDRMISGESVEGTGIESAALMKKDDMEKDITRTKKQINDRVRDIENRSEKIKDKKLDHKVEVSTLETQLNDEGIKQKKLENEMKATEKAIGKMKHSLGIK